MEDILGVTLFTDHFLKFCGDERRQPIILDSHRSHETVGLIQMARENNIDLLALPPHTTQYLNQLDKTVFGPFQREYNNQCTEFMSISPNNLVTKWEWPRLFKGEYVKTFNKENIAKGFEVCSIYPVDRQRIPKRAFAPATPFNRPAMEAQTSTLTETTPQLEQEPSLSMSLTAPTPQENL